MRKSMLAVLPVLLLVVACSPPPAELRPGTHGEHGLEDGRGGIKMFDDRIARDATDAAAFADRGKARHMLGELDSAVDDLNEALQITQKFEAVVYERRADVRMSQGKYDLAIADYDASLARNPDAEVYNSRGNAWHGFGDKERAIVDYDTALGIDPDLAEAYQNRGLAWQYLGKYEKAIADYDKAIELNPNLPEPYYNRANTWADLKEHEKAIADFDRTIELFPHADVYHGRGFAYENLRKYDEAIADYDAALRLKPGVARAHFDRGRAWLTKRDFEKAIADLNEAIRLDPECELAHFHRAFAWQALGQDAKSLDDLNEAIRLDPTDSFAFNQRGWLRATSLDDAVRDGSLAIADATKACEMTEWKHAGNLDTLAAAYAEANDFPQALLWQQKAIDLSEDDEDKQEYHSHLDLYQSSKPLRSSPEPPPTQPQ